MRSEGPPNGNVPLQDIKNINITLDKDHYNPISRGSVGPSGVRIRSQQNIENMHCCRDTQGLTLKLSSR